MSCYCILCQQPCECGYPPLCDLCDRDDLTEDEVTTLNLFLGGNFYQVKKGKANEKKTNR